MNDEHREIERVFLEALGRPADQRLDYVARATDERAGIYDAVCELLRNAEAEHAAPIEPPDHPGNGRTSVNVRIRGYEILEQIGQGGMGVVFRARQQSTGQVVAVKLIRSYGGPPSESLAKRFEQEWRALGRLDHPGIARVLDAGRAESDCGVPYLVMEYVDGPSLREYVDGHELPLRARLLLMALISEAVHHAHQRLVIHRDLKPANIRVTVQGNPKILDFGLARILESDSAALTTLTSERDVLGTLAYMSPEQAAGDVAGVDVRSDVYALGVILYELMTGALPHDLAGLSLPAAIRRICEQPVRAPESLNPHLSRDVLSILNTALARDRANRYGSAGEFAADLRHHLAGEPVSVRAQSGIYQLARFAAKHRVLVSVIALLILAVPGLTIAALKYRAMSQELGALNQKWALAMEGLVAEFTQAANRAAKGDWERAADYYAHARRLLVELDGADSPRAVAATYNFALVLLQVNRFEEAERLLREVLHARESLDRLDPEVVRPMADLGRLLIATEHLDEAEKILAECQSRFEEMSPPQLTRAALAQAYRGRIATKQRRFQDAETLLSTAIATFESVSEQLANYRSALRSLVELYEGWTSEDAPKELADKLKAARTRLKLAADPGSQP